ncbi:MAG: FMN-binding protein [Gudongella sp.]|nr:FMN-binding protein [Gudongella sp.]
MKKTFWYPIVFMAGLTAIFTFILAYMEYSTADIVKSNQDYELETKILYAFNVPIDDVSVEAVNNLFESKISQDGEIYEYTDNGELKAYAFPVNGPGLWGSIEGYVAISKDYSTILGLTFITQSETPGLGGRIGEEDYLSQFRELDVSGSSKGEYVVYNPAPGGNVDAIAGATLTSKSVAKLMNEDIHKFIEERKGE